MKHARPPHTESPLIFTWDLRDHTSMRLFVATLLTFAGLAGLFVIFRIITPESRPISTRPQQIIVLNPNVPAERALIHQAVDRSFPLLPTETLALTPLPVSARMPEFSPSSQGWELRLKPLNPAITATAKPRLLTLDLDVLPPLPQPAIPAQPPPSPPPPPPPVGGELAARLKSGTKLADIPLMDPTRPRFHIAVGSLGQVLMALPLSASEETQIMPQLHAALTALHFTPAAEKEVQWGQVSFRWEKGAAP